MAQYVHSSPWQDAANFGGAIGDRLTQALIELPLKKSQYSQQLLQNAAAMKMQQAGVQNTIRHEQVMEGIGTEANKIRAGAVETRAEHEKNVDAIASKNAQTKAREANQKYLGDITKGYRADRKLDLESQHVNTQAEESHARILKMGHGEPDPFLFGHSIDSALAVIKNPLSDPTEVKKLQERLVQLKVIAQKAQDSPEQPETAPSMPQYKNIGGSNAVTAPAQPASGVMVNPKTGQKIKLINGQWTPIQ